jgi:hypothetical protein
MRLRIVPLLLVCACGSHHAPNIAADAAPLADAPDASGPVTTTSAPLTVGPKYKNGDVGIIVKVRIGNDPAPVSVILDTGSVGLRVLSGAVPSDAYQTTDTPDTTVLRDGTTLTGQQATAVVAIGDAVTPLPITLQVIDQVSCGSAQPDCAGSDGTSAFLEAGTTGILGVGMHSGSDSELMSPMVQLDQSLQTYSIGIGSSATTGTLTVGVDVGTLSTTLFQQLDPDMPAWNALGGPTWDDQSVAVCWEINNAVVSTPCAAQTVIDSGTTNVQIAGDIPANEQSGGYLDAEELVQAYLGNAFAWDAVPTTANQVPFNGSGSASRSILGMPAFKGNTFVYDPAAGRIGVFQNKSP